MHLRTARRNFSEILSEVQVSYTYTNIKCFAVSNVSTMMYSYELCVARTLFLKVRSRSSAGMRKRERKESGELGMLVVERREATGGRRLKWCKFFINVCETMGPTISGPRNVRRPNCRRAKMRLRHGANLHTQASELPNPSAHLLFRDRFHVRSLPRTCNVTAGGRKLHLS